MILGFLACTPPDQVAPPTLGSVESVVESVAESSPESAPLETEPGESEPPDDGLHGQVLDPPLALPEFAVVNHENAERTPEWLVGHPSVVWFFRDSSEGG